MTTTKILRYIALGLGLLYTILMLLMAMDSLPVNGSWTEIQGFLIHISPGLIVLISTVYGSLRPKYGRYLFTVIVFVFTWYYGTYKDISLFMSVSFPLVVITIILFLASFQNNNKK